MPQTAWSPKRERQFQHIKQGVLKRGGSEKLAEEIAARTVNKERAQQGESSEASKSSLNDIPASRRGGMRSHKGAGGRTYQQLYAEARSRSIKGRSGMSKAELEQALRR
ncbi:plasmid stabilization protein [Herbaspirillum lusitanum]|uniref:Plasmid stabilization protein n=1 Tax=Herbaspirillum lusitanum TaxID=213312 RepID=A0ABW9A5E6_9BURK